MAMTNPHATGIGMHIVTDMQWTCVLLAQENTFQ